MARRLTYQQKLFADNYIACMGNAAEAARKSGYSWSCAKQTGYSLLRNPRVQAEIQMQQMVNDPQEIGKMIAEAVQRMVKSDNINDVFRGVRLLGKIHGLW